MGIYAVIHTATLTVVIRQCLNGLRRHVKRGHPGSVLHLEPSAIGTSIQDDENLGASGCLCNSSKQSIHSRLVRNNSARIWHHESREMPQVPELVTNADILVVTRC